MPEYGSERFRRRLRRLFEDGSVAYFQARKRSANPNLWVRISSGGVGVFHVKREGEGAKKFGKSLEAQAKHIFRRDIPGFGWDIPGAPEKFEKKN